MKVSEIMTHSPAFCWLATSAITAASIMQQRNVGMLPVTMDAFTPKLVGVVTDRDLCLRAVAAGRDPAAIWMSQCMTKDPIRCTLQDDVHHALQVMRDHQLRRLPVVNMANEIAGVVSLGDLIRRGRLESKEIEATLKALYEPGHANAKAAAFVVAA